MARGINDDTYVDVGEDDDRPEPGGMEFSDDEEEPFREEDGQDDPADGASGSPLGLLRPGTFMGQNGLDEWLRAPGNSEEMLKNIDEM